MLLATGFPGGGFGDVLLLLALVFGPFVLAGLFLLAGGRTLVSRRGPARWAAVTALVVPIVWTVFGVLAETSFVRLLDLFGPIGPALTGVLLGAPLGFASVYGVTRLLDRAPRHVTREAVDSALIAVLPALLAWSTFRILGVLPTEASPLLLVSPALATFGGLWAAAALGLTWARLRLLRREEARAERLRHAARPLSAATLSD